MSGTMEMVLQAHDLLHKGNISAAHEVLHKILGVDNAAPSDHQPLQNRMGFDHAFRTACRKNGAKAMYLLADNVGTDGRTRIISGGDADMCAAVSKMFGGQP